MDAVFFCLSLAFQLEILELPVVLRPFEHQVRAIAHPTIFHNHIIVAAGETQLALGIARDE